MADQLFELQTYTPNSDIAAGFQPSQIIWSRGGNDTLLGLQPNTATPGQLQIDTFIGDFVIDDPTFRQWSDTYILGDSTQSYYDNGNPFLLGLNDFGLIVDFNPAQDFIQLHGSANDYQLVDFGFGEALIQQTSTGLDTIGLVLGNSGLSLEGNYFQFTGNAPPQPVLPQIQQLGSSGFDLTSTTATDPSGNVYIAGGTTGSFEEANNGDSRDALVAKYDSLGNLLWTKQFGTSSADTIYSIDTDNQGNFYVAGFTEGDLATPRQAEVSDAWLAKYDSNGNQQWIQQFGEASISQGFSIDVDNNGNAYLSGITVKPAPEIATDDLWVTKYDTNGNRQWFTELGSSAFDESYAVAVSNDGSVYAGGWTIGDFAGENVGVYDAALAKLDNNGQVEWTRQFGTPDYEWTWGVDTDSQGNVYATGWTLGNLGGESAGSYDAFLVKYDSQGNQQWIKQFGSAGDDEAFRINIDSNDNIFLTGYTNGSLGGANAGSYDAWVAKYDTDGNQSWIKQFGTPQLDHALGITTDKAGGDVYVTGVTGGSLGATNSGSFDSWLAKLNTVSGTLENFSGTPQPITASPVVNASVSNTSSSALTSSTVSNTSSSALTSSTVSDTSSSALTGSTVSNTSDSQLTNQPIADLISNFFQEFIQDNNLQLFAEVGNDPLNNGIGHDLLSAVYGNDSMDSSDNTSYDHCGNDTLDSQTGDDWRYGGEVISFESNNDLLGLSGGQTFESLSIPQGTNCGESFPPIDIDNNDLLPTLNCGQADTITSSSCAFI
ncbi:MAG TPA: SBBP repeat-containing protein [Waterburya sp.]